MALNFPSAPNTGDIHTVGSIIWKYNGKAWDSLYEPSAPAQVGLSNVDNTSDEDKPVSTAQQAALDALTKDDVGLDNVDNTSDINKPVSTAQQAAIDAAGGGSSFDQDLNTTDSPTFVTVAATNLSVTDVYAGNIGADNVDVDADITTTNLDASGTVTADEVATDTFTLASGGWDFTSGGNVILALSSGTATVRGSVHPAFDSSYDLGRSSQRWKNINSDDIDASGTVTAGGFVGTPQTLTDAATITYDLADGHNSELTITANRTLALPTNLAKGASGVLTLTQDGTGGRELALATGWFVSAGSIDDISALGAGEQAQITWYAYAADKVNATILPLQ